MHLFLSDKQIVESELNRFIKINIFESLNVLKLGNTKWVSRASLENIQVK